MRFLLQWVQQTAAIRSAHPYTTAVRILKRLILGQFVVIFTQLIGNQPTFATFRSSVQHNSLILTSCMTLDNPPPMPIIPNYPQVPVTKTRVHDLPYAVGSPVLKDSG